MHWLVKYLCILLTLYFTINSTSRRWHCFTDMNIFKSVQVFMSVSCQNKLSKNIFFKPCRPLGLLHTCSNSVCLNFGLMLGFKGESWLVLFFNFKKLFLIVVFFFNRQRNAKCSQFLLLYILDHIDLLSYILGEGKILSK